MAQGKDSSADEENLPKMFSCADDYSTYKKNTECPYLRSDRT